LRRRIRIVEVHQTFVITTATGDYRPDTPQAACWDQLGLSGIGSRGGPSADRRGARGRGVPDDSHGADNNVVTELEFLTVARVDDIAASPARRR
jgi:hypothetical protein